MCFGDVTFSYLGGANVFRLFEFISTPKVRLGQYYLVLGWY